jgi:hypothetical protein
VGDYTIKSIVLVDFTDVAGSASKIPFFVAIWRCSLTKAKSIAYGYPVRLQRGQDMHFVAVKGKLYVIEKIPVSLRF